MADVYIPIDADGDGWEDETPEAWAARQKAAFDAYQASQRTLPTTTTNQSGIIVPTTTIASGIKTPLTVSTPPIVPKPVIQPISTAATNSLLQQYQQTTKVPTTVKSSVPIRPTTTVRKVSVWDKIRSFFRF